MQSCNHESTVPGESSNFHTRMVVQRVYVSQRLKEKLDKEITNNRYMGNGALSGNKLRKDNARRESRGEVGKGYSNQGSMWRSRTRANQWGIASAAGTHELKQHQREILRFCWNGGSDISGDSSAAPSANGKPNASTRRSGNVHSEEWMDGR